MSILDLEGWGRTKPPLGARHNPSHPLSQGLVGHWIMNENGGARAYDISGSGRHGTITLAGGTGGWVKGQFGPAVNFDGADTLIDCGTSPFYDTVSLGPLTFSAWIFPRTAGEGTQGSIVSKCVSATTAGRTRFWIDNSAPEVDALAFLRDGSTDLSVKTVNSVVTYNEWQHVVVTWTGSVTATTVHIYKNGTELGYSVQTNGASFVANTSSIVIGNWVNLTLGFDGIIDDVRFYNRALNIDEVSQLYLYPFADMAPGLRVFPMGEAAGGAALTPTIGAAVLTGIAGRMDLGILTPTEV